MNCRSEPILSGILFTKRFCGELKFFVGNILDPYLILTISYYQILRAPQGAAARSSDPLLGEDAEMSEGTCWMKYCVYQMRQDLLHLRILGHL